MSGVSKKPIIGILGGICAGKSEVAAAFGRLGCAVIDADKIAKELLDRANIKAGIVERFGKSILDSSGKIDRKALAKAAFSDPVKLEVLTKIIHPPVLERTEALIETYQKDENIAAIVLDMPLLAEVGWEKECDKLVFVDCRAQIRAERAKKRGINEKELKVRENFQISLDKKASLADYTLNNNSELSEVAEQIRSIIKNILGRNV